MRKNINKTDAPKNDDLFNLDFKNELYLFKITLKISTKTIPCLHEKIYLDLCKGQKKTEELEKIIDKTINKIIHKHKVKNLK